MPSSRSKLRVPARYLAPAALALALAGTVSCSTVWDDVGGFFEDDEANVRVRALSQSGEDQDFPKLSDVPDTPRPASSPEDLNRLSEGLVADRDEARYTTETLRRRERRLNPANLPTNGALAALSNRLRTRFSAKAEPRGRWTARVRQAPIATTAARPIPSAGKLNQNKRCGGRI